MSLINQMLKDLEQRRSGRPVSESNLLKGLYSHAQLDNNSLAKIILWGVTVGLAIVILIFIIWRVISAPSHLPSPPKVTPKIITVAPAPVIAALPIVQQKSQLSVLARAIGVTGDAANTQLTVYLNRGVHYSVTRNFAQNSLSLILDNTQLAEPLLPLTNQQTAIKDLQAVNVGDALQITLALMPDIDIQSVQLDQSASPKLILNLANKNQLNFTTTPASPDAMVINDSTLDKLKQAENSTLTTDQSSNSVKKILQPLSSQQFADATWQHAVDLIQQNQVPEAISTLRDLIQQAPNYLVARTTLITLLVQQHQVDEAEQVASDGLQLQPQSATLAKLAAQVLMLQSKPIQALAVLQAARPPLAMDPDYYALMAAIYQRVGRPLQAAKLYDQLVQQYPNNGILWVGFATSLESLGKAKAAREAYQNADVSGGLSPQLQAYVESRIQVLN